MSDQGLRDAIAFALRDEYGAEFVFGSDVAVLEAVRGYLVTHEYRRTMALEQAIAGTKPYPCRYLDALRAADRVVGLRDDEEHQQ